MAIYTTRYSEVFGKQIPTLQSPRGIGIGPASGAGRFVRLARFAFKHRKAITGIGSVGIGALLTPTGVDLDGPSDDKFGKALRATHANYYSRANNKQLRYSKRRKHAKCSNGCPCRRCC